MSASSYNSLRSILHQQMAMIFYIPATLVFPTIMRTIDTLQRGERQPYHTSILSGKAWVQELLHSHPRRICTELGVEEPVFRDLVITLHNMGHNSKKFHFGRATSHFPIYLCHWPNLHTHWRKIPAIRGDNYQVFRIGYSCL